MIIALCWKRGCGLGAAQHCAKQKAKAFGTVLATAPSPTFYKAAKKPLGYLGGFFAA